MGDLFWAAKIHTLVKSLNLEETKKIFNDDPNSEQVNFYFDALEIVLAQFSNEAIIHFPSSKCQ